MVARRNTSGCVVAIMKTMRPAWPSSVFSNASKAASGLNVGELRPEFDFNRRVSACNGHLRAVRGFASIPRLVMRIRFRSRPPNSRRENFDAQESQTPQVFVAGSSEAVDNSAPWRGSAGSSASFRSPPCPLKTKPWAVRPCSICVFQGAGNMVLTDNFGEFLGTIFAGQEPGS